ncbi:hypothetical protein Cenrod_2090 [Candidatus Symbiobacter mobilis CR]|uniref:Uncharacterized protein n=1 Tax=Candidatus Symbiobacter mobilis CR TaxID=946483 RepID=U5N9B7_9BURK|nr:hypothetical protein Cenrod_2090 [Candidatus Symbiobacter mobilis CR]
MLQVCLSPVSASVWFVTSCPFHGVHPVDEIATHPIALLAARPTEESSIVQSAPIFQNFLK